MLDALDGLLLVVVRGANIESTNAAQSTAVNAATTKNTQQDTRLTNLEKATGGARYLGMYSASAGGASAQVTASFCVLTFVSFGTTSDNHGHSCNITKSGAKWRLQSTQQQGSTSCKMACFD